MPWCWLLSSMSAFGPWPANTLVRWDWYRTGATGLVGTRLVSKLTSQGHSVRVLTRNPNAAAGKLPYPRVEVFGPSRWNDAVKGSTVVINLAGALIACLSLCTCSTPFLCVLMQHPGAFSLLQQPILLNT